jgi:phosphatidylserine decarboxylase
MTAVGATNVGSIHFEEFSKDPELKTNRPSGRRRRCDLAHPCSTRNFYYSEKNFENSSENPNSRQPEYDKGQAFGHFAFGSTIVLIFEAPKNFKFEKVTNDRILVGQSI